MLKIDLWLPYTVAYGQLKVARDQVCLARRANKTEITH